MVRIALLLLVFSISLPAFAQDTLVKKRWGKYGVKANGKWIVRPRYDSVHPFAEERAAVLKKGKWGFVNGNGETVIERKYNAVQDFHGGLAGVRRDGTSWGIINRDGRDVAWFFFDTLVHIDSFAVGVKTDPRTPGDSLYSIYHYDGKAVTEVVRGISKRGNRYLLSLNEESCGAHRGTVCKVVNSRGVALTSKFYCAHPSADTAQVIYDCSNKEAVLSPELNVSAWYTKVYAGQNGFRLVKSGNKSGIINSTLKEIIPANFTGVQPAGSSFIATANNVSYVYDSTGNRVLREYTTIEYLGNELFRVAQDGNTQQVMNAKGNLLPGTYRAVYPFQCGAARVVSNDNTQFGYIDANGALLSQWYPRSIAYNEPYSYNDVGGTVFRVFMGVLSGGLTEAAGAFNNIGGEQHVAGSYTSYYGNDFKNGYAFYTISRKAPSPNKHKEEPVYYGVIDSTGKVVVQAQYDAIAHIDTLLLVSKNGGYGLITHHGKEVLAPTYGKIKTLGDGFYEVQQRSQFPSSALYRYNGVKGELLTLFEYSGFSKGGDSTFIIESWPNKGYIDYNGKLIVPVKYSQAYPFENGKAKVSNSYSGGEFYINRKGRRVE